MPAVARTPAQRGKVGNWLVESRLARGWETQQVAREQIARLTGWTIPQSVYAEWESGRRLPSDANLERLQAFYGTEAEQKPAAAPEGTAAVIAALGALVDAQAAFIDELREDRRVRAEQLSGLIQEMRTDRLARQRWEQGFFDALEQLARAATLPDDPPVPTLEDAPVRRVPQGANQ